MNESETRVEYIDPKARRTSCNGSKRNSIPKTKKVRSYHEFV